MKKMGLFWFAAALLGAALIFSGCETEADTETKYVEVQLGFAPPADAVPATSEAALQALLADTGGFYNNIIYDEAPSAAITVPDGKTLYLAADSVSGIALTSTTTVTGKLVVYNGPFTPGAFLKGAGTLEVEAGGELVVSDATLFTGATTKLGAVNVKKFATLDASGFTTGVSDADGIKTWLGYAGEGRLEGLTVTTLTPSATLAAIGTPNVTYYSGYPVGGVSVVNNVPPATGETSLTIPVGVYLTTNNALAAVTSLTVNGELTASSATLNTTAGATITLGNNGNAILGGVKLAADVTVPAGAQFSIGDTSAFNTHTVTYTAGGRDLISDIDLTFSAVSSDGWTLAGNTTLAAGKSIVIPASVIVPVGVTLENNGTITLAPSASAGLVLAGTVSSAATAGAKLKGTGSLKAGATTITGEWQALGAAATTVTIAATSAVESSITASATTVALTASAAGATITQAAVASNNLTIGENTTIALGGVSSTPVGAIVLKGSGTAANVGKLTLLKASSKITGDTTKTNTVAAASVVIPAAAIGASVTGKDDATTKVLGELAGADTTNTIATSAAADVTINAATTIAAL